MSRTDRYGRRINYLRISVTDRCNLRCTYCMPPEGVPFMDHSEILRYEEIIRLSDLACQLGFTKFRITGGEPLVRRGLPYLVQKLAQLCDGNFPDEEAEAWRGQRAKMDLALTTNGVLLARYADALKSGGLRRINISLDTLRSGKFRQISRFDLFEEVMKGIDRAMEVGFDPIKINVVVVRGVNDDEILDFVEMTRHQPLWVRFIELMPFSRNNWREERFMPADEIKRHVESHYELTEIGQYDPSAPAVDYQVEGHRGFIGFIAPLSRKFCDLCNRLRLTADGRLLPCLHSDVEIDIKTPMREGASDEELKLIFQEAIMAKPKGHTLCRDSLEKTRQIMSKIGG